MLLSLLLAGCGHPEVRMAPGLIDTADTLACGLPRLEGVQVIEVYRSNGYVNNVLLTCFQGQYYCMWQQSERDEDTPDTGVWMATSADAETWSEPTLLAAPGAGTFASPGGWVQRGDTLSAIINRVCAEDRSQGGNAFYTSTADGCHWTEEKPVLMADGTPVDGIFEQDPLLLPDGRTVGDVHFRPGNRLNPVYTDDPSALRGWKEAAFPEGEGKPIEPSQYLAPDGRLVLLMRDQNSSFVKLVSYSDNNGASWSVPVKTNIPDSRSKQCAGTLPDGRSFWVGNPTGNKSRRVLALGLSQDGYLFNQAYLLLGPMDLPPQRQKGRYKTLGYNYPKATVIDDTLWISLSLNKEDAVLVRVSEY